jgi:hypothetical protein
MSNDATEGNEDVYQKYIRVFQKVLPIGLLWVMGETLNRLNAISETAVIYFIVGGFTTTIVWMLLEMASTNADSDVMMDLNDKQDTIDRTVQGKIYAGLQQIRFINEHVPDQGEMQQRMVINGIAAKALVSSVFQNHYSRKLGCSDTNLDYLKDKCHDVETAFSDSHHHFEYRKMVVNRLPEGVTFTDAIASYVNNLLLKVIIPALLDSCEKKIGFYESLLRRGSISRKLRREIKSWLSKNMGYVSVLTDLRTTSCVLLYSKIMREAGSNGTAT